MPDSAAKARVPVPVVELFHDYPSYGLKAGDRLTPCGDGRTIMVCRTMDAAALPPDLAYALGQQVNPPLAMGELRLGGSAPHLASSSPKPTNPPGCAELLPPDPR